MTNKGFIDVIASSFRRYLETDARSNEKLKILHGAISKDLAKRLPKCYNITSLGFEDGKESKITGRYVQKTIDITVKKDNKAIAGIAVKFVMCNYMQNSNNYFKNMLGETANIRAASIPYFQIFIIPDEIPYYKKDKTIAKFEKINEHNLDKYIKLSNDNVDAYMHTPNKTFIGLVSLPSCNKGVFNLATYREFYLDKETILNYSNKKYIFGNNIIYNDYEDFISKVVHFILSI